MAIVAADEALQIERLVLGPFGTNCYIVVCRRALCSAIIDAPAEVETIQQKLSGTRPEYILLTHNHRDHTGALAELHSSLKVPLAAHAADSTNLQVTPERLLEGGETLSVGALKIEVLHTPGHTPGSLCFKVGRYLLSGDTIFARGPGRTGSPEALRQIIGSLTGRIFVLPDDTQIYPGHGEATVLKKEREEFAVFSSRPHDPNLYGDIVWLSS